MSEKSIPIIRQATSADVALLVEIGAVTFYETFAADNTEQDMATYLAASFNSQQQADELADPLSIFLIAEVGGVAAGYAMLQAGDPPHPDGGEKPIELVRFYVYKQWHGRGVAKTLMEACLDEADAGGFRTLWLGVWEHNGRAQAFYRKWQFEEFGEHVFQLGADEQNDILMRRPVAIS